MTNLIAAIAFCFATFITGLSVTFAVMSKVIGEDKMFYSLKNAIITYTIGLSSATVFTILSFLAICNFQNFVHY